MCAIVKLRKYIALAPGRKGITMPDTVAQILELFRQLNPEQKKVVLLSAIFSSLASEQEASAVDPVSSPEHTE